MMSLRIFMARLRIRLAVSLLRAGRALVTAGRAIVEAEERAWGFAQTRPFRWADYSPPEPKALTHRD